MKKFSAEDDRHIDIQCAELFQIIDDILLDVPPDVQDNDDDNLDSLLQSPDVQDKLREVKENAEEITR
jgi:hypothetical protein